MFINLDKPFLHFIIRKEVYEMHHFLSKQLFLTFSVVTVSSKLITPLFFVSLAAVGINKIKIRETFSHLFVYQAVHSPHSVGMLFREAR